jgi:hypothetical protein
MKKIVTIFDKDYKVTSFISKEDGELKIEILGDKKNEMVEEVIDYLKQNKPRFMKDIRSKDGMSSSVIMEKIEKDDDLYMDAVAQEFKMKGLRSFAVPVELREALLVLSHEDISKGDREKVIGDIINIRGDMLKDFAETFKGAETELRKIKENREDWHKLMDEKIASLKK